MNVSGSKKKCLSYRSETGHFSGLHFGGGGFRPGNVHFRIRKRYYKRWPYPPIHGFPSESKHLLGRCFIGKKKSQRYSDTLRLHLRLVRAFAENGWLPNEVFHLQQQLWFCNSFHVAFVGSQQRPNRRLWGAATVHTGRNCRISGTQQNKRKP